MKQEEKCGVLLHQIHNALEKRGNNQLKKKGLTFSQIHVLANLMDAPEKRLSFKELEKRLALAQSTTVGLISRLEQKKLVAVSEDREDRRIKFAAITPRGLACGKDAEKEMDQIEAELLDALSEEERESFRRMLKKIDAALQKT